MIHSKYMIYWINNNGSNILFISYYLNYHSWFTYVFKWIEVENYLPSCLISFKEVMQISFLLRGKKIFDVKQLDKKLGTTMLNVKKQVTLVDEPPVRFECALAGGEQPVVSSGPGQRLPPPNSLLPAHHLQH